MILERRLSIGLVVVGMLLAGVHPSALAQAASPPTPPTLKIVDYTCGTARAQECSLSEEINIRITKASFDLWRPGHNASTLILVLNSHPLKGQFGRPLASDANHVEFQFDMRRLPGNEDNKHAWNEILSKAQKKDIPVQMALALDPVPPNNPLLFETEQPITIRMKVLPDVWGLLIVGLVIFAIVFIWLAIKTDLIRDGGAPAAPGRRRYYSLARAQMAWWFYWVVAGFLYLWAVAHDSNTLTNGILALIGISATTGLAAVAVDTNKAQGQAGTLTSLQGDEAALQAQITQLTDSIKETQEKDPQSSRLGDMQKQLTDIRGQLARVQLSLQTTPAAPKQESQGFLKDILTDSSGVSFTRFQMVIWTVVLTLLYVQSVYAQIAMPDFDATLLGLMGISSGTYLGFKFPANS